MAQLPRATWATLDHTFPDQEALAAAIQNGMGTHRTQRAVNLVYYD
jgi:hypothetical protein